MAQCRNILSTLSDLSNFIANETGRQWHVCDEEILEDRFGQLFGKLEIRDKIYYAIEDDHVEVITLDVFMQITHKAAAPKITDYYKMSFEIGPRVTCSVRLAQIDELLYNHIRNKYKTFN